MQISELLKKQRELDTYIAKEKGLGDPYDIKFLSKRKLALSVEVGELANATRCFKYWSEKPAEPKERLLDELADCIHFTLSLLNLNNATTEVTIEEVYNEGLWFYKIQYSDTELVDVFNVINDLISNNDWANVLGGLIIAGIVMDFTPTEIEQAYLKKHEVNYKRQVEGY